MFARNIAMRNFRSSAESVIASEAQFVITPDAQSVIATMFRLVDLLGFDQLGIGFVLTPGYNRKVGLAK